MFGECGTAMMVMSATNAVTASASTSTDLKVIFPSFRRSRLTMLRQVGGVLCDAHHISRVWEKAIVRRTKKPRPRGKQPERRTSARPADCRCQRPHNAAIILKQT